jgi:hypothetical protein
MNLLADEMVQRLDRRAIDRLRTSVRTHINSGPAATH